MRAVVVNWNGRATLEACLRHLLATRWPGELEVVVVDNGSTDGSADIPALVDPAIELVAAGTNRGFAAGTNLALRDLDGFDAVALVNPDAFVEPGWLTPLAAALDADPQVGAACPKIRLEEPLPGGRWVINNAGNELRSTYEPADRGLGEPDDGRYDTEEDVWGWCGAAVLLRRAYLDDVGLLDERLFLYGEDVELSWRGRRRGWRYRYVPAAVVRHRHRASSGGTRTPLLDLLNRRNRLVVVTRHGGLRGRLVAWSRALGGIAVASVTDVLAPLVRGRRPDLAPLGRRVRAVLDAARLLAGGDPPLPNLPEGRDPAPASGPAEAAR